mmetsp:Transcript_30000/g.71480  ORF Transcript_30000/g.71480 Transcript_30000/m.71480 type:complete len:243 (-) Transcript_30000:40-768(-)
MASRGNEGDLVYVPVNGKLQDGKIVKPEERQGVEGFFVRLVPGERDEWFPASALQLQSAVDEQLRAHSGQGSSGGGRGGGRRANRGSELKINLPDGLRWQLINDWEQVCKKGAGVPIPRKPSVMEILYAFRDASRDEEGYTHNGLVNSLQVYFDESLFGMLLYPGELELFEADGGQRWFGKAPSTIFGAEHLLRLVVKMPELLSATEVTDMQLGIVQSQLHDLVSFLANNQAAYFTYQYCVD